MRILAFLFAVTSAMPALAQQAPPEQQLRDAVALRLGTLELENAQLAVQVRDLGAKLEAAKAGAKAIKPAAK